jgi:hypothetical protein
MTPTASTSAANGGAATKTAAAAAAAATTTDGGDDAAAPDDTLPSLCAYRLHFFCPLCLERAPSGFSSTANYLASGGSADAFPGYLLRVLSQVAKEDAGAGTGGNPPAGEVVPQWDDDVVAALELSVSALENALRVQPRHAQTAEFGALMQDTLELLLTHVASTADTASTSSAAVLHRAQRLFRVQQGVFASLKHVINRGARTGYLFAEDIYGTGSSSSSTPTKVVLVDENREHLLPSTESGGGLRMTPAMNAGLRKLLLAAGDEHVLHTGLRKVSDPLGNAVCVCAAAAKRSGGGVGALGKTIRNAVMGFMDAGNDDGSGGGVGGTGRLYESTGSGRQPENNGKGYDEVVSTVGLSTCAKEFLQRGTNALVVRVKL